MVISRRRLGLLMPGFLSSTALAGCNTPAKVVISDAQVVANDAAQILALGIVPAPDAAIASLVLTGFQALLAATMGAVTAGDTAEQTAITALTSSMTSLQGSVPSTSPVYADAGAALAALKSLAANDTASAQTQAEAAVGTALIAYLTLSAPAKAELGAEGSQMGTLAADARARLAKMKPGRLAMSASVTPHRARGRQPRSFNPLVPTWNRTRQQAMRPGRYSAPLIPPAEDWLAKMPMPIGGLCNAYDPAYPAGPVLGCCTIACIVHILQMFLFQTTGRLWTDAELRPVVMRYYGAWCGWVPGRSLDRSGRQHPNRADQVDDGGHRASGQDAAPDRRVH